MQRWGKEKDIFKPTIENKNLCKTSNDNGVYSQLLSQKKSSC